MCADHARRGDTLIADGTPILLVTVSSAWTIAGSTTAPAEAIDQAIATLQQLAERAGLRVRIGAAGFQHSRYYPSTRAVTGPRANGGC